MESSIWKHAASFLRDQKNHKLRLGAFVCLAALAVLGTAVVLKYNGIAMTHKEKVLECPYTVHTHTQSCYATVEGQRVLVCGQADYVVHTHNADCYNANGELVCPLPEVEDHKHSETCYTNEQVLVCAQAESAGHQHGDACYTTEQGDLICGTEEHQHGDECYDEAGSLICTLPEHVHTEDCYSVNSILTCGQEEGAGGHTHDASCYETRRVLSCGKLEQHTHDAKKCYDENNQLICEEIVLEEHVHSDECFTIVELTPEEVAALNSPIFFTPEDSAEELSDADDESELEDSTVEAEGSSVDESTVLEPTLKKIFQNELLTVTAAYYEEANIPEEAELDVQLILDEAQYQARLADAEVWVSPEDTAYLYEISFLADGEEIEPEDMVYITMEINYDALPNGAPVSVVHFGKKGPELLDASNLEQNADGQFVTMFDVDEFSEFLLILGEPVEEPAEEPEVVEKVSYALSDSFTFETDDFQLTIQVDGIATAEKSEENGENGIASEDSSLEENAVPVEEPEDTAEAELPAEADGDNAQEELQEATTVFTLDIADGEEMNEDAEAAEEPELLELTAEDVESELELLTEDDEIYAAFAEAAQSEDEDGESKLLNLSVMRFVLSYQDAPLDLTECKLTAEITPKETVLSAVEVPEDAEAEVEPAVSISLMQMQGGDGKEAPGDVVTLDSGTMTAAQPMMLSAELDSNTVAVQLADVLDFQFTVQYYAWLQESDRQDAGILPIIDTSKEKNGGDTAVLPQNGVTPKVTYLTLDGGKVAQTEEQLLPIFDDQRYQYKKRPGLSYIELLPGSEDTGNYDIAEVWVLKAGRDLRSEDREDWDIYDPNELTISNDDGTGDAPHVKVTQDTVIRLVYRPSNGARNISAVFYDYDISNGPSTANVVNTAANGINSVENCSSDVKLAFGNANAGTNYGMKLWNGAALNTANNSTNKSTNVGYSDCTFGLVNGIEGGVPCFAVASPLIFGDTPQVGKTVYPNEYSLSFNRVGDTYTLSSVNGTSTATGLDCFSSRDNWNHTKTIYYNNFWPMDSVTNTDPHFGETGNPVYYNNGSGNSPLPDSDNNVAHNTYFGMQYAVEFEYDMDYAGPLEYLFFGDDDMWVFLDDTLVADIGGVHSAVGQYVDLWDYLMAEKEAEKAKRAAAEAAGETYESAPLKHKLYVFYTERGASGSTCYMQFTLPAVKSISSGISRYDLEISKTVEGVDIGEAFDFDLTLENVTESYSYAIYTRNGPVMDPERTTSGTISSSTAMPVKFQLKHGEYLQVNGLQPTVKYTVTESAGDGDYSTKITQNGNNVAGGEDGRTVTGVVQERTQIAYTNRYQYALPESGGAGTTLFAFGGIAILAMCLMYGYSMRRRRERGAT